MPICKIRLGHLSHHLFKLENLDLSRVGTILRLNVDLAAKFFSGSGTQRLFQGSDQNFNINALVPAYLFHHTFDICYKHQRSPL
jgi:hypothetical protein